MAMSESERGDLLSRWIKPSSEDEHVQQDRAQRMVTDAVKRHDTLKTASLHIYTKGSYANNTNVRRDSDVATGGRQRPACVGAGPDQTQLFP